MNRGLVVYSLAGHDKGNFQVVINADEKFALVCDGKSRPIERPKKKNIIHLKTTKMSVDEKCLESNKSLRLSLRNLVKGLK